MKSTQPSQAVESAVRRVLSDYAQTYSSNPTHGFQGSSVAHDLTFNIANSLIAELARPQELEAVGDADVDAAEIFATPAPKQGDAKDAELCPPTAKEIATAERNYLERGSMLSALSAFIKRRNMDRAAILASKAKP